MENKTGKIEKKTLGKAITGVNYCTFVIDGLKYNTFDEKIIDGFKIDDSVIMEGENKVVGDKTFWNMKSMRINDNKVDAPVEKPAETPAIPAKTNGVKEFHLSPEEVKCRALEGSLKFWDMMVEKATPLDIIEIATQFEGWIYGN